MNRKRRCIPFLAALTAALMTVSSAFAGLEISQQEIHVEFEDTRATPEPAPTVTKAPEVTKALAPTATKTPAVTQTPTPQSTTVPIPVAADTPASEELRNAVPGSVVSFGSWIQTSDGEKTPLQWLVTEVSGSGGSRVLTLISLRMIKADAYHKKYSKITWEKCSLREWLNDDFNYAFSRDEQAQMLTNATGAGTEDRVWIPSPTELAQIDAGIRGSLQGYTERGASYASIYSDLIAGFWLRGGSDKSSKAPYAAGSGMDYSETEVDCSCGVRPMIRVAVNN